MICVVALVFVGPQKLPGLLRTLGLWVRKARSMVYDMRAQSGIDEILRAEGFDGGLNEVRSMLRGQHANFNALASPAPHADPGSPPPYDPGPAPSPYPDPNFSGIDIDVTKEYPPEGADAYGALPDDLFDPEPSVVVAAAPEAAAALEPAPSPTQPQSPAEPATEGEPTATTSASSPTLTP